CPAECVVRTCRALMGRASDADRRRRARSILERAGLGRMAFTRAAVLDRAGGAQSVLVVGDVARDTGRRLTDAVAASERRVALRVRRARLADQARVARRAFLAMLGRRARISVAAAAGAFSFRHAQRHTETARTGVCADAADAAIRIQVAPRSEGDRAGRALLRIARAAAAFAIRVVVARQACVGSENARRVRAETAVERDAAFAGVYAATAGGRAAVGLRRHPDDHAVRVVRADAARFAL